MKKLRLMYHISREEELKKYTFLKFISYSRIDKNPIYEIDFDVPEGYTIIPNCSRTIGDGLIVNDMDIPEEFFKQINITKWI